VNSSNNGSYGLIVQNDINNFSISTSIFSNNGNTGLYLLSSLSNSSFTNISSNGNIGEGLHVSGATTTLSISNSIFTSNSNNGLSVAAGTTTVSNVTANSNLNDGVSASATGYLVCDYCIANDNGVDGIGANGDGFSWHNSSRGIIKNSSANNNKKSAVAHVNTSSVVMFNNIFTHDTNGTIGLVYLEGVNHEFYNNIVASKAQVGGGVGITGSTSATLKNNIIYGFSIGISNSTTTVLSEDYNVVYNTASSSWSGLTPGVNSFSADPKFTNFQNGDYTLLSSSPAINKGTTTLYILDRLGNPRVGIVDIGPYEYQFAIVDSVVNAVISYHSPGSSSSGPDSIPLSLRPYIQTITTNTPTPSTYTFTRSLSYRTNSPEVKTLQQYLNLKGFTVSNTGAGSIGKEKNFFGPATRAALIKFQKANNIKPSVGFFGPITRAFIQKVK
jgi:hypothetical protein